MTFSAIELRAERQVYNISPWTSVVLRVLGVKILAFSTTAMAFPSRQKKARLTLVPHAGTTITTCLLSKCLLLR
jgi:hypothetical protein